MPASAQAPSTALAESLRETRELITRDPKLARAALAKLHAESRRVGSLPAQLEAAEIECRLALDTGTGIDTPAIREGLAVADTEVNAAALLPLRRLQACTAGWAGEEGDAPAAWRQLQSLVERTRDDAALAPAHALALLERGAYRSRRGALSEGQHDLLAACELLRSLDLPRELDLCLAYVANHYRRTGDFDEALHYLQQLLERSRARGAGFDEGIHLLLMGQTHAARDDSAAAIEAYEQALRIPTFAEDRSNKAWAEAGIGDMLLRQGRHAEARELLESALPAFEATGEHKQSLRATIFLATALTRLGQPAAAHERLSATEALVGKLADPTLQGLWLGAQAETKAAHGDWRAAYESLTAFRDIEQKLHKQQLSDQSRRLRMQFDRERDTHELVALRQLNERGDELRRTQALALGLFVLLLAASLAYAVHKVREARRMRTLALSDELTGLPNRRAVHAGAEALHRHVLRSRGGGVFSVMLIDVDHFKRVNDTHGHAVGDEVLRHLADLLPASLREGDMLGRIGGEEFLAVLSRASAEQAMAVAERMRQSVERTPADSSVGALPLSVSIGLAWTDDARVVLADLIKQADAALYKAKSQGRNRVVGG